MPRDGGYSGQGYNNQNNNSNGNTNAWGGGRGGMNQNLHQQQHSQPGGNAGYHEQHVPVNGFNPQEAIEMLTRGM